MREKTPKRAKGRSPTRTLAKKVQETAEHARLKATLKEIIGTSGFRFDTEVALNFTGNSDAKGNLVDERSIDVAVFGSIEHKSFLIIFECKGGAKLNEINQKISSWEADIDKIKNGRAKITSSDEKTIKESDFAKFDEIRICYVFSDSLNQERYKEIALALKSRGVFAWDNSALTYYKKTASTIGRALRYQILREFEVRLEPSGSYSIKAVQIRQGELEMFVFGAKPSVLMKIGYVSRRASGKPDAYQRILNKDRIAKLSEFLSSRDALLPNAIIIAFDSDSNVQSEIKYDKGKLHFPIDYCYAWIIDGQHRVFGFLNTPFEKDGEDDSGGIFELPIVAFRSLDPVIQNRTFVSINYYQKKIDPALLCDLSTALPDLQNELTWPSLLVAELNKVEPLKDKVKISELDKGKQISLSSFARYGLLESLLGYDKKKQSYEGVLNAYSPVNSRANLTDADNQEALKVQANLLRRYFEAVALNTSNTDEKQDPWRNTKDYSLLKPTGINALLLVLSRIMEKYPKVEADIHKDLPTYLNPLRKVNFEREFVAKQGGGWKGFRKLANIILRRLNADNSDHLRLFGKKEKK